MRAPCQRVHHTGYRGRTKDAGIGLSDQGRPASGPAATQEAPRENFRKFVHGVSGKSPALRTALARPAGKYKRSRLSTSNHHGEGLSICLAYSPCGPVDDTIARKFD